MNPPCGKRRLFLWGALVIASVPILLLAASLVGLLPWSPVNGWHYDMDIASGRIRYTRYLFWVPWRQVIEDSALTKALRPEDLADVQADWHRVQTFSPGVSHSPHYHFHSATAQIRELEIAWTLAEFTPAARRTSAKRVLQLWQLAGRDNGARDYLRTLGGLARTNAQPRIEETDLPRP